VPVAKGKGATISPTDYMTDVLGCVYRRT